MAATAIMPLHIGKGRTFGQAISKIIDYVANPEKTQNGELITSFHCESRCADAEFALAKRQYLQKTGRGRKKDDVIAYHVRQAFRPGEITAEEANRIGVEFAKRFTKENHAFVVCTHTDKAHIHNHIIWSAVNLECDRKFRNFWGSTKAVRNLSDTLCIENGLSVIENPKDHGSSYNKWLGNRAVLSHREQLRQMLDEALEKKPDSFEALLKLLQEEGCEVIFRGKSINLRARGWKKCARLDSLGDGYSKQELSDVIDGKQEHIASGKAKHLPSRNELNLLLDIQNIIRKGKGPGYENWAKRFNLKQLAQTYNFLQEKGLLSRDKLEQEVESAAGKDRELRASIRAIEDQMKANTILRNHILNYIKTRDIYVEYRKAGYSKKFYMEHEPELLIHKASKKAFDELGLKKLPNMKSLQVEYSKLMSEKKTLYGEYHTVHEETKRLMTAKANIDAILRPEQQTQTRSKMLGG